jgi:peptide/nickel transport system substrate-binding protein
MAFLRGCLLLALAIAAHPAAAEELRLGFAGRVTSLDPHFFVAPTNMSAAMSIFDRLLHLTPDSRLAPGLAASWRPVGDAVWEFRLRPGVTWHDGQELTAEDVAFTIARVPTVPNSPGGFAGMVRAITRVEIVDRLTLHLHTAGPRPNVPADLASVAIVSRHAGEGAATEDYNSGKATIGTGPFRLVRHVSGDSIELERNDGWWGPRPEWQRVRISMLPNTGSRTAALLAGDIDVMEFPAGNDLARLRADPRIVVLSTEGMQTVLLTPDYSRAGDEPYVTDKTGGRLAQNPFRDLRVRQALSLAINRRALAERALQGTAAATGQWLPPAAFGYAPDIAAPPLDVARARALLAQAGYPDGFRLTIHAPSDRLPTDVATVQAVAQMWTRIGVVAEVEASPFAVFAARASRQELSMRIMSWNSATGGFLTNVLATRDPAAGLGMVNNSRYSNPALDSLIARSLATLDDAAREALLVQATSLAASDVAFIPLYQIINIWALRKGLTLAPRQDQRILADEVHRTQ